MNELAGQCLGGYALLDRRGKIKVMDFGLARALGLQKITIAKTLIGNIYYASPEAEKLSYTLQNVRKCQPRTT